MIEKNKIRNCKLGYRCDKRWDDLIATSHGKIRHCEACDSSVYFCDTPASLADAIMQDMCVAFDLRLLESLYNEPTIYGDDSSFVGSLNATAYASGGSNDSLAFFSHCNPVPEPD